MADAVIVPVQQYRRFLHSMFSSLWKQKTTPSVMTITAIVILSRRYCPGGPMNWHMQIDVNEIQHNHPPISMETLDNRVGGLYAEKVFHWG